VPARALVGHLLVSGFAMRTDRVLPRAIVAIAAQCYAQSTGEGKPAPVDVSLTAVQSAG
jgi:hypothetical protein